MTWLLQRGRARDGALSKLQTLLWRPRGGLIQGRVRAVDGSQTARPWLTAKVKKAKGVRGTESPGHEEDVALLAHEAGPMLQQQPLAQRVGAGQASPKEGGDPIEEHTAKSGGAGAAGDDLETGSSMGAATDLEAEAEGVAAAVLGGERVEVRGEASGVMYQDDVGPDENAATTSEVDDPPREETPSFLSSPEDWVTLQAALERGPNDGLLALVSLAPILKENAKPSITFSTTTLDGADAETVFAPEARAWLLQEFSTFQEQRQGLEGEQLVSEYVRHVKQIGVPDSLQRVEVFVNIDRLGSADEKELAYTIATLHHEMTHAHQLLSDYLGVFPKAVSLEPNWLGPAYPLERRMVEDGAEESAAMEIGAYSEQAKALEVLGVAPRGDYFIAVSTLEIIHEHWSHTSPEFRESADADGKFAQAYMVHLKHFLAGFAEAVRPLSNAILGGFDVSSLAARRATQGGLAGTSGAAPLEEAPAKNLEAKDQCVPPTESKPEGIWAPDSEVVKQFLEHRKSINQLAFGKDKYELLRRDENWSEADGVFRKVLEQQHDYSLASEAVDDLAAGLERAKYGGSTTSEALSAAVKTRNQQASDPNIFVPTPVRFYEAGSVDILSTYREVPSAFARNALGCDAQWSIIEVSGYSDDLGDDAARESISRERAEAVKAILVDSGVPGDRVLVVARGYEAPPGVVGEIENLKARLGEAETDEDRDANDQRLDWARKPYRQALLVAIP